jgi:hypothetical protein
MTEQRRDAGTGPDNVIRAHHRELAALMADGSDPRVRLVNLLRLSEAMVHRAMAEDWEAVDAMERQRRADLDACFGPGLDIDGAPAMIEAVAVLLQLNEKLLALVAAARERAASASRAAQGAGAAVRAYRGVPARPRRGS